MWVVRGFIYPKYDVAKAIVSLYPIHTFGIGVFTPDSYLSKQDNMLISYPSKKQIKE